MCESDSFILECFCILFKDFEFLIEMVLDLRFVYFFICEIRYVILIVKFLFLLVSKGLYVLVLWIG